MLHICMSIAGSVPVVVCLVLWLLHLVSHPAASAPRMTSRARVEEGPFLCGLPRTATNFIGQTSFYLFSFFNYTQLAEQEQEKNDFFENFSGSY